MTSDDEIAFVLSHEASHQIAGHISKQRSSRASSARWSSAASSSPPEATADGARRRGRSARRWMSAPCRRPRLQPDLRTRGRHARRLYRRARRLRPGARRADLRPARRWPGGGALLLAAIPASAQRQSRRSPRVAAEIRRQQAAGLAPRPDTPAAPSDARFGRSEKSVASRRFLGLRVTRRPPKYPSTAADGAASLTTRRKNREARGGTRQRKDANQPLVCRSLFEIWIMMKGYVGGLVSFRRIGRSAYRPTRVSSPMMWVSASLFVGFRVPYGNDARRTMTFESGPVMGRRMCRGSICQERRLDARGVGQSFQLESLILAQNERWRQA